MGKLLRAIRQWNFDRKMKGLVSLLLVGTSLMVLMVSTISSFRTVTEQSRALLQEQNRAVAAGFENSLNNCKALAYGVTMSEPVQRYLSEPTPARADDLRNLLRSTLNMSSSLNFLALLDSEGNTFYKGNEALTSSRFEENWREDYQNCRYIVGTGMRLSFNNRFYDGERFTLNLYFPVYDTNHIGRSRGLLCMNFSDKSLEQVLDYTDDSMHSGVAVTDGDGVAVAASAEMAGEAIDAAGLAGGSGAFRRGGRYFFCQNIRMWPFYVVSSVSEGDLFASGRRTVWFSLALVAAVLVASLVAVSRAIRLLYRPLDKLVRKMDAVAQGAMDTRMNENHVGADFKKLACGFNSMMDRLTQLMEQIKEEQRQMEQIRFNALQSQIKPHFLYNTLECVHWQAVADRNGKISTLVKALARYYRICLSGGEDVIPLASEIEHVRCYVVIQNMRYGDIIDSALAVPAELQEVQIPKITLQPLVENSIYHGIKVKEGRRGRIALSGAREGDDVLLTLSDTGAGMSAEQISEMNDSLERAGAECAGAECAGAAMGYGVSNVHRRIQLLYGARYGLRYARGDAGGVTVTIRLPIQRACQPETIYGALPGSDDVSGTDR